MKTLFAIIAVMIVRSNAQGSSGAAAAIAQATEILGSLQNQISQNVSGSFGLIQERLGKIPADFDGINERIMAIEKGLSGEALKQFQKVAAQLTTQIQSFDNDLLSPLIDRSSRIANLLNPLIETLNFPFTNEECFLNEITKITGNATEVVKKTELEITEDTNGVLKQINDLVSNLQDQQIAILDEAVKCGVRSLCIAQQVAKAANLIVTITLQTQIQVRKFVMALTSVENEVFLTVSSDVQKRLSLIQQDLAACA